MNKKNDLIFSSFYQPTSTATYEDNDDDNDNRNNDDNCNDNSNYDTNWRARLTRRLFTYKQQL